MKLSASAIREVTPSAVGAGEGAAIRDRGDAAVEGVLAAKGVAAGPRRIRALPTVPLRKPRYDLGERPFIVIWELTRACDLACRHCRAEAVPGRHRRELTTEEGFDLIRQIAELGHPRPVFVMTGGDPLKRSDLLELVAYSRGVGLPPSLAPSVTPLLTPSTLSELRLAGMAAVSLSLDGSTPELHDGFRGVPGSFTETLAAIEVVRSLGIRLQINTTVGRHNLDDLADVAGLVERVDPVTWSVFFMVPTGRASTLRHLSATECEDVLHFLYDVGRVIPVKATEAPQYRRVVIQRQVAEQEGCAADEAEKRGRLYRALTERRRVLGAERAPVTAGTRRTARPSAQRPVRRSPMAVSSGNGFLFVSHTGDVFPSGFLPIRCGSVREQPLIEIYRGSPLLRALRDPARLEGKCGLCDLKEICGGSRSRAFGVTGNPFAEEPWCSYEPGFELLPTY